MSMRIHFMSDLHLERQDFPGEVPEGDVLILAGDICQACALDSTSSDPSVIRHRERVQGLLDAARRRFAYILLVAGNHEHYGGIIDDTDALLRRNLPDVTVLENESTEIGGLRFFGATLWSDLEGRSPLAMAVCGRGISDYHVIGKRRAGGGEGVVRLTPRDTLKRFDRSLAAVKALAGGPRTVVATHHAPSRLGLNPAFRGNGYDGGFASELDELVASLGNVPVWVHGHTHVQTRYRLGATQVLVNCRGYAHERTAAGFDTHACFEI